MQNDTRKTFEGLILGLVQVNILSNEDARVVLHEIENHVLGAKDVTSPVDVERIIASVLTKLPDDAPSSDDKAFIGDDDEAVDPEV